MVLNTLFLKIIWFYNHLYFKPGSSKSYACLGNFLLYYLSTALLSKDTMIRLDDLKHRIAEHTQTLVGAFSQTPLNSDLIRKNFVTPHVMPSLRDRHKISP